MPPKEKRIDISEEERTRLSERLKQAREYLDLSQDEVAKAVGLPRAAISLIESGQRRVEALELKKFARIYERPTSYFTGEESPVRLPEEVEHLARAAASLSSRDREELTRFAEFLQVRGSRET
jgi:transcriptional regulator with XRE-family HTH domain